MRRREQRERQTDDGMDTASGGEAEAMDKIDFVTRRFKQILPDPVRTVSVKDARDLQVWLRNDLCSLIENYARRTRFRELAAWVLRAIVPGANTAERQTVEDLESAVVECARALDDLASKKQVGKELRLRFPPQKKVVEKTVRVQADGEFLLKQRHDHVDELSLQLSQLSHVARSGLREPVNVNDFFEPQQVHVKLEDGRWIQRGEFILFLNPELLPVGNFVVRCMFSRIEPVLKLLAAMRPEIMRVVSAVGRRYRGQEQAAAAWTKLQENHAALRKVFQTGPNNQLRDSMMILTQVYAAFGPSPELDWLGLPAGLIEDGAASLRHRVSRSHNGELFERIAAAVDDLRELYEGEGPAQSAIDEAIDSGGLVINQETFEAFWEVKPVGDNWQRHKAPWKLLVALAKKALHRADVVERDLYIEAQSESTMATVAGRLKSRLPASLWKLIVPGRTARSYRLMLEPDKTHLFG
jgi:hypothetical protein